VFCYSIALRELKSERGRDMEIVYVLTNPAFEGYVKIGKTTGLERRLRDLDNTSVPLPFRCVFAVEVDDGAAVERLVHQAFADHRTRSSREFFEIDPQRAIAALKLTGGRNVTPKGDIAQDDEGIEVLAKPRRRGRNYSLADAGLKPGDVLHYVNDENVTAEVVGTRKILFEGDETSLSAAALTLLHKDGYTWGTVAGPNYWMFQDETVSERRDRLQREAADVEDEE